MALSTFQGTLALLQRDVCVGRALSLVKGYLLVAHKGQRFLHLLPPPPVSYHDLYLWIYKHTEGQVVRVPSGGQAVLLEV